VSLDIYEPACGTAWPIVVWVHGGGWQTGDKANRMDDKVAWAAEHGWMLVSVNYRLSPEVVYPAHNDDVATAIGWVIEHAPGLGADADRVALMGHSAGAGIVAAVGIDESHLNATGHSLETIDCVAALDTEGYDVAAKASEGDPLYLQAFGTDPSVWAAASPVNHIAAGKGIPDFIIFTRGTPARRDLAKRFADALGAADVGVSVIDVSPLAHEDVNTAVGAPGDSVVTPPLTSFIEGCFATPDLP
jgi:acetyl esterase/lipase